ncbi:MAG: type II secretion system major pseudopilin GspG [Phycisphaerae bacterium]|nr:type II secretion system major pseudopilin GspG [Phycisphaerae bacterium]
MNNRTRRRNRQAFTIVEILVVVIIIAVLATMIVPKFLGRVGQSKQAVAKINIGEIEKAIEIFSYDYERWPLNLDELVNRPADIDEAKWNPPTIRAKNLLDPWERQFLYRQPGEHGIYDIYTHGKDGQEGGEGEDADIGNWQ